MQNIPLTPEQKTFAADNHGLVYKFLNENQLPEDEFYDVVIFGYLRAVRRFFVETNLQKYSFSTIAWNCMRVDLFNYNKMYFRKKRNAETISIHLIPHENTLPIEETLAKPDELMLQLETKLLLHDLAGRVSRQQMDMIRLKTSGYSIRDIAHIQKIPMKCVKEALEEVRQILIKLCYE
ncbi:sigma-70 family RNA polymerase sigma factor [Lachnoclostridium edouardi]|uniref:sigma-70 family RNA polymerase sigma factor n=1 Tax=Lachnoclostridium edouardi TaxID=1926283 RepID=UPI000C7C1D00|nr:sigma-70 family RNA polymerase sigma factor [Lachnoclostridium edouardi]